MVREPCSRIGGAKCGGLAPEPVPEVKDRIVSMPALRSVLVTSV